MTSKLHIQTSVRNGKTFLKSSFCNQPFKIADITEGRATKDLRLMIMSSSPGILDGDEYLMKVEMDAASSLHLETQSYQRLFRMKTGASQTMEVRMNDHASLIYLQHPVVPHEASTFVAKNKIFLSGSCSLLWGEVLTCGRKLNGESFCFSSFHNITEVYLHKKLVVKENLLIKPTQTDINSIGQLEGYSHQASLICIDETISIKEMIIQLRHEFAEKDFAFGVTELPVNGLIVRVLGSRAEQLFETIKKIAATLQTATKHHIKDIPQPVYAD